MEVGLPHDLQVLGVVPVQLDDMLNERLFAGEIEIVQEALGVELLMNAGTAPIDGQAARLHSLNWLLGRVARQGAVFKGDVELAGAQELQFGHPVRKGPPNVVKGPAGTVHPLVLGEPVKEIHPLLRLALADIADHEGAKACLGGENRLQVLVRLVQRLRGAYSA